MDNKAIRVVDTRDDQAIVSSPRLLQRIGLIQTAIKSVMKNNVHYGVIPGTDKPTLFKAGAEVLFSMFRISIEPIVTDLSTKDCIRYQVKCIGVHTPTGEIEGYGVGEASTDEEKYKWRGTYIDEEYNATPEDRRRIKFIKKGGAVYQNKQIRTNPADLANTVLKMAKKRAQIDLCLTALAASDCFAQDLEDLPDEIRRGILSFEDDMEVVKPPLSAEAESTLTALKDEAAKGTEGLQKAWGKLTKEQRQELQYELVELKKLAAKVGAEK